MPRKRYYKKKGYTNINENDSDRIKILIGIVILGFFGLYQNYIKPNIDAINYYGKIFLYILFVLGIFGLIYYFYNKMNNIKLEKERINNIPDFLRDLESKIREFKPIRQYDKELLYQTELVGFLKNNYPDVKIEETRDYSRPDIIVDDIAIEIKGPTNMDGMKSLPDKINSYLPKWNYLFIVLFNIKIVSNPEKNKEIYNNKKQQIIDNIIDSKKDKVFFIEI